METHSVRKNPLVAFAVVVAVVVAVFALSYVGLLAVAGNDDYEGSAVDTSEPANEGAASLESATGDLEPVFVSAEELSTPATPTDTSTEVRLSVDDEAEVDSTPVDEQDCDAFFAEMDEEYYANQERLAEVYERFGISFERVVHDDDVWLEVDYEDPIVDAITYSFWTEVDEARDDSFYDHPCFDDIGCADGEDYEMSEEEIAELRAEWTIENEALVEAFTEAGIDFGWETDEYFEIDVVTWDYEDEAAMAVYLEVFNELHPEFAEFEEAADFAGADEDYSDVYSDEDYAAEMETFERELEQRNALLEALAGGLGEAGVDHEITNEYDWTILTFDVDDDRAVAVVAAVR